MDTGPEHCTSITSSSWDVRVRIVTIRNVIVSGKGLSKIRVENL